MIRFMRKVEAVPCFGQCGTDLTCKCQKVHRLCLVHGKYGSLCLPCFSHLVASTVEGVPAWTLT